MMERAVVATPGAFKTPNQLRRMRAVCDINDKYVFIPRAIFCALRRILNHEAAPDFYHPVRHLHPDGTAFIPDQELNIGLADIVNKASEYADYEKFNHDLECTICTAFMDSEEDSIRWRMACSLQVEILALSSEFNVNRRWRRLSHQPLVRALADRRRQRRAALVLWLVLYHWQPPEEEKVCALACMDRVAAAAMPPCTHF